MNREKTKGFTLIELLVVIAIIAILAIAIVVAYNRAKEAAKSSKRIEVVRAISTAQELYAQANNDEYATNVISDLADDEYLADPSEISPDCGSDSARWNTSAFSGVVGEDYYVNAYLSGKNDKWFSCTSTEGCKEVLGRANLPLNPRF